MAAKIYMGDNNTFADAFNYVIYDGEPVIKPHQLRTKEEASVLKIWDQNIGEKIVRDQYVNRIRDVWKECVIKETEELICIYAGIENQSYIHYAMPVKAMLYDALAYAKQVEEAGTKHRENKDPATKDEFLSGFHKRDRLKPIITLVIYFGTETWDGPRQLSDLMEVPKGKLQSYIADYKILLIEPNSIEEENFEKFSTDLGMTLRILKNASSENKIEEIIRRHKGQKISRKAADVLQAYANIEIPQEETEEEIDMCKAWDDHYQSGKNEGLQEGRKEGREEGKIEEARTIANALYQQHMEISFIASLLQRSEEQIKSWL